MTCCTAASELSEPSTGTNALSIATCNQATTKPSRPSRTLSAKDTVDLPSLAKVVLQRRLSRRPYDRGRSPVLTTVRQSYSPLAGKYLMVAPRTGKLHVDAAAKRQCHRGVPARAIRFDVR